MGDSIADSGLFHSDPHVVFAVLGYGAEASHRVRFVFRLMNGRGRRRRVCVDVCDKQNKKRSNNCCKDLRPSPEKAARKPPAIAEAGSSSSIAHPSARVLPIREFASRLRGFPSV